MVTPLFWGSEFVVNRTVAGNQSMSTITALADGRFAVAWRDDQPKTANDEIRAQAYNADGTRLGLDFAMNGPLTNIRISPAITGLLNGGFAAVWTDVNPTASDSSGSSIRARVNGVEFQVNTSTSSIQSDPAIATLEDGRMVVTWHDFSQAPGDTSSYAVRAQILNADGTRSGAEFVVNTKTIDGQLYPGVTALPGGGFVVVWTDENRTIVSQPKLDIKAQIFDAAGVSLGGEVLVATDANASISGPQITGLPNGGFVAVWTDRFIDVRGQVFNPGGSQLGNEFRLGISPSGSQISPVIAALPDGRFVAVWQDDAHTTADTFGSAIVGRVFNGDGSSSDTLFLVNSTVTGDQTDPSITVLADGRFVVSWSDFSTGVGDIRGQIFDPRIAGAVVAGSALSDDYVGSGFDDQMSGSDGDDRLVGGAGNDRLAGESGDDRLMGDDGNDTLLAGSGLDLLDGGLGDDVLNGGAGGDTATGGAGDDVFVIDSRGDLALEAFGGGFDVVQSAVISLNLGFFSNVEAATLTGALALNLTGSVVDDVLTGNRASNVVKGLGGADQLIGGGGSDDLIGGGGADTLTGGSGPDVLTGGAQADHFTFANVADAGFGAARDHITDFQHGIDKIDLSAFMAGGSFIGAGPFVAGGGAQVRYVSASGLLAGDLDGDTLVDFQIRLDGSPVLTAGDVLL